MSDLIDQLNISGPTWELNYPGPCGHGGTLYFGHEPALADVLRALRCTEAQLRAYLDFYGDEDGYRMQCTGTSRAGKRCGLGVGQRYACRHPAHFVVGVDDRCEHHRRQKT